MDLSKRIKRHVTAVPHNFRAVCHLGFERTCAHEFRILGLEAETTLVPGSVLFTAKLDDAWKLLAFSRTATRFEMQVDTFKAENFGRLEKKTADVPWELYLPNSPLPDVRVNCKKSRLYHSDAVAERVLPIVHEALKNRGMKTDTVAGHAPQTVYVHLENDRCTLSVDISGEALYKRGLDRHVEEAPVQDTLAASILLEGGLLSAKTLIDPMAGSGTFSCEAAFLLVKANLWKTRHFAAEEMPAFRPAAWNFMVQHTAGLDVSQLTKIVTSDLSAKAFSTLEYNLKLHGIAPFTSTLADDILSVSRADFFAQPKAKAGDLLVLNPPYGKRISADITYLYREIGKKLRSDFSEAKVAIMVPGKAAEEALAFAAKRRIESSNGGIDVTVMIND